MTEIQLERKNNGQIKGKISRRRLILFLHNTTSHTQHLYQIKKILGIVVPEIYLTKKRLKHTHIVTEKTNTIYPLYTSYAGNIKNMGQLFFHKDPYMQFQDPSMHGSKVNVMDGQTD